MIYKRKPQTVEAVKFDGKKFSEDPRWLDLFDIFVSDGHAKIYSCMGDDLLHILSAGWVIFRIEASGEIFSMPEDRFDELYEEA